MSTSRRDFLKSVLMTGLAGTATAASGAGLTACSYRTSRAPNFLILVADDHGAQLGALGTPELRTPHIDSIAEAGALFSQAFTVCPLCTPSRASILTGRYPHENNARVNVNEHFGPAPSFDPADQARNDANGLPADMPTLVEVLSAQGYRCGITSKFHLPSPDRFPFDAWLADETAEIFDFFAAADPRPWLLWVNLRSPHRNFDLFQEGPAPNLAKLEVPGHLPHSSSAIVRQDYAAYLRAIQRTDRRVGEVLAALTDADQSDRTLVCYLGDHGPAYHRAKMSPYDLGLRIPLCVSGPAGYVARQGDGIAELVSTIDLMPTLLDYAGVTLPVQLPGRSLRPLLAGQPNETSCEFVFGEVHHGHLGRPMQERSVYDGRYRLIFRDHLDQPHGEPADNTDSDRWGNAVYDEIIARRDESDEFRSAYRWLDERNSELRGFDAKPFELYDLSHDRWELDDLYGVGELEPVAARLQAALWRWLIDPADPYVDPNKLLRQPA